MEPLGTSTPPDPRPPIDSTQPTTNWWLAPFRRAGRWYAHQPRAVRLGIVAVLAAGLVAGAVFARAQVKKRAVAAGAAAWGEYQAAVRKGDTAAMRAALDQVLAADPAEPNAARFKAILDRGAADPDTPELAVVLLNHHVAAGRVPEAAREAEKVLARFPKHWLARCARAHHALQVLNDRDLAGRLLAELPDPEDPEADLQAGGVLYALRLSDKVGWDAGPLRRTIARRLAPVLRRAAAASAPPAAKAQLVECYLEPFAEPDALGDLLAHWGAADQLAETAVVEAAAAGDVPTLVRLAGLGPRMRAALGLLHRHDPARLPPDRVAPLARALDDRTRRAWQAVREKAPDRPEAYRGLALLAHAENKPDEALRQLLAGVGACGDRAELLDVLVPLVAHYGTDESVQTLAAATWRAAEAAGTDPTKWCLAAVAQDAVRRPDRALEACRKARAVQPAHAWACVTEARLRLRAGDAVRAGEALAPLGEAAFRSNPELARLHARVLVGAGRWAVADDEFKATVAAGASRTSRTSAPAVAFLFGILDAAPPDAARAAWVDLNLSRLLADDPAAPFAPQLRAQARFVAAELSAVPNPKNDGTPPVWDAGKVAAALKAIGELSPAERAEPGTVTALAALQLKGQGDPAAALRTLAPVLAAPPGLPPAQAEVVGAVLTANGRPAEAVEILRKAVGVRDAPAGYWVALALAYRANNQPIDAGAVLGQVLAAPARSAREHAEYIAAKILFQRENP